MAARDEFVKQYRPLAENVGKALGVSPDALVAQWGLETAWGKSIVPGTNNLGNIKDFSGNGIAATDNMTGSRDKYRKYDSPEAFGLDYVELIGGNKRYANALNTGDDVAAFARGLKSGGYAEDPDYERKMIATTNAVRQTGGWGDRIAAAVLPSAEAASNPFDQFDAPKLPVGAKTGGLVQPMSGGNVFDQFDGPQSGPTQYNTETPPPAVAPALRVRQQDGAPAPAGGDTRGPDGVLRVEMSQGQSAPAAEPSLGQQLRGGMLGRAAQGFLLDPVNAGAQLLANAVPEGVSNAVNSATQYVNDLPVIGPVTRALGMTPATPDQLNQQIRGDEQQYQAARAAVGDSGFDYARLAGNVVGTAPLAAAMAPAAGAGMIGSIAAAGGAGAMLGGLQPVTEGGDFTQNKLAQMGIGAAGGSVISGAGNALARVISPRASTNPQIQRLMDEGVTPTPGQIVGGPVRRAEDIAMSVPIVGDAIRAARTRGIDELNVAALNRAVAPLGTRVTATGREGMQQVNNAIRDAYDRIVPRLSFRADGQFSDDLGRIMQMGQSLPPAQSQQLENILRNQVLGKMTPQGAATGQNFREIESELSRLATGYRSDPSVDARNLGLALGEVLTSLRGNLQRSNPQAAQELAAINNAYSQFTVLQRAAGGAGAIDGSFSPAQLAAAVRQGDKTMRKNAYARGDAQMQDLSDAAKGVMSGTVPNSGTADRAMLSGGALAAGAYNPMIPLGLGAASLPYLPGVNRLAAAALARRPGIANQLANGVNSTLPAFGAVAVPALNQPN